MSKLRKVTKEGYADCLKLGENAFNYKLTEQQISRRKWQMNKQDIYAIYEEDQLAAKLHLLPLQVFLGKSKLPIGGIAGVATWPEYRRKGYVAQLMTERLKVMRQKGMSLSLLHPFSIPFYRKFGFELTQYTYTYDGVITDLSPVKSPAAGKGKLKRLVKSQAAHLLNEPYEKAASRHSLMLGREAWWWEQRVISEDSQIIGYERAGEIEGYLIAQMKEDRLVIEEFIYHSKESFQSLLQWMKNHDSMTERIEIAMLPSDLEAFHFGNPNFKEVKKAYFMARIVDLASFIKTYPFIQEAASAQLRIKVNDAHAPWNDGVWEWTVADGHMTDIRSATEASEIEMDIQTLTAILLGSLSVGNAAFMGRITGEHNKIDQLAAVINPKVPAFLDFF